MRNTLRKFRPFECCRRLLRGCVVSQTVKPDKYARDARAWKNSADIAYRAATLLFGTRDLLLIFPAATLGHHALEMYLKAALICEGSTIFDPTKLKYHDPSITPRKAASAWAHDLVARPRKPPADRSVFDLTARITLLLPLHHPGVPA